MSLTIQRLHDTLGVFELDGDIIDVSPVNVGHINDTFIAAVRHRAGRRRYTLQRINGTVFSRPDLIMHNIMVVTEAIDRRVGCTPESIVFPALRLVPTRHGHSHHTDDDGACWRCYHYVEGITYSQVPRGREGLLVAREAAAAFRRFADHLKDLDTNRLHITIENFHNTPVRFLRLKEAVAGDSHDRVRDASPEIDHAFAREGLCGAITRPLQEGDIPLRVAHNDTKINNVVFADGDKERPTALCVIDLDTVMPGSPLFDFGDLVRSSVCRCPEDETNLDAIHVDLDIFEALAAGFFGSGGSVWLTEKERDLLVTASMVITMETGLRFLTDYLVGDVYFRTERPRHNLDRARAQLRLLTEMEKKRDALERIVKEIPQ